jgi:hypothetical protein
MLYGIFFYINFSLVHHYLKDLFMAKSATEKYLISGFDIGTGNLVCAKVNEDSQIEINSIRDISLLRIVKFHQVKWQAQNWTLSHN